ncbi:MAG: hypothetical protein JNJ61_19405 [Anaerolineae bacterium]|nr:hypothetical protein [Anaerolineae bacterium]
MNEITSIYSEHYIGAVRFHGDWRVFHELLSMWILDYRSYDDTFAPKEGEWRYNLMIVDQNNAEAYIESMAKNEILVTQIPHIRLGDFPGQAQLTFVVNFDEKLFINGWHDNIPIHEYVPQDWTGIEATPYDYIPSDLRLLWNRT